MEFSELVARERIRETLSAYNHFGDRGRADDLAELFTEDGVLESRGSPPATGRTAIAEFIRRASRRPPPPGAAKVLIRHHVSNILINEVTPNQAQASSYFLVLTLNGIDRWGRYRDTLVPVGDHWLFRSRLAIVDGGMSDGWLGAKHAGNDS